MSPIVVLGANGFIGSHLVDSLVAKGREVWAVCHHASETLNISSEPERIIAAEISSSSLLDVLPKSCSIIDAIGTSNPTNSIRSRLRISQKSPVIVALEDVAKKIEIGTVYFCSSGGAIYGDLGEAPRKETDQPRPTSPYGLMKYVSEQTLFHVASKYGFKAQSWRFSNPYGPRQSFKNGQGIIPRATNAILAGESIPLFSDIDSTRDYIYIEDAVEAAVALASEERHHEVFNIGSGIGTSLRDVLLIIERHLGRPLKIIQEPPLAGLPKHSSLDISRLRKELGTFKPITVEEGFSRYFASITTRP